MRIRTRNQGNVLDISDRMLELELGGAVSLLFGVAALVAVLLSWKGWVPLAIGLAFTTCGSMLVFCHSRVRIDLRDGSVRVIDKLFFFTLAKRFTLDQFVTLQVYRERNTSTSGHEWHYGVRFMPKDQEVGPVQVGPIMNERTAVAGAQDLSARTGIPLGDPLIVKIGND